MFALQAQIAVPTGALVDSLRDRAHERVRAEVELSHRSRSKKFARPCGERSTCSCRALHLASGVNPDF
jgi:hypothetical protein